MMRIGGDTFSILFTGDFAPCRGYERVVMDRGYEVFGDLQKDIADTDLSFINLETPLCLSGDPIAKCGPNIRAHPDCVNSIKQVGFDIVCLANNHIMDFGEIGLTETLNNCHQAGLKTCGAGLSLAQAQEILYIEKKDLKIAFIAVAEHEFSIAEQDKPGAAPLDPIDNTLQIEEARQVADLVFVSIHGGNEYFPYPRPGLRKLCRYFINRGVDAVICHHAHIPGAYEIYEGKPIVYSLGNLIFDRNMSPQNWEKGYALRLEYELKDKNLNLYEIVPYTQSVAQSGIRKMHGKEKKVLLENLNVYQNNLENENAYNDKWIQFVEHEKNIVLMKHFSPVSFRGARKVTKLIEPGKFLVPTENSRKIKLNMVRCESHLEVLQEALRYLK